eukprot:scaffold2110_cov96-Skeletonema_marinoi.AAC.2
MYYDKAISSAKDHKFVHEEALACELAAYFYLEMGEINNAAEYCLLAHERYQTWGAIGKCTSLFKFFDGTLNERVASSPAIANANESKRVQRQRILQLTQQRGASWGISQFLHQRHVLYDLDQRMMRKRCSFDDCTNIIVKKEDFARHGANVKG